MIAPLHALLFGAIVTIAVDPATGERTARFRCEEGPTLSVVYDSKGALRVIVQGGAYRLKPAGKNRWSDGQGQNLVIDDDRATWTSGVDGTKECGEVE